MNEETRGASPADGSDSQGPRLARGVMWYLLSVALVEGVVFVVTALDLRRGGRMEPGMRDDWVPNAVPAALYIATWTAPLVAAAAAFVLGTVWNHRRAITASLIGGAIVLAVTLYGHASSSAPHEFYMIDHAAGPREVLIWLVTAPHRGPYTVAWFTAPLRTLVTWLGIIALAAAAGMWVGRGARALRRRVGP